MEVHQWVLAARKHAKLTQQELGDQLSVTKSNVSGWENNRHQPSFDQLRRISDITGVDLPASRSFETAVVREPDPEYAGRARSARTIPVVGSAKLGEDGFYEEVSSAVGHGDGHIEIETADPNAYGLRVRGQSMFPAIRDGWYVLVEPNMECHAGGYVLIRLRDGRKMVKELLFVRGGSIEVMSVNGGDRLSFDASDLEEERGMQAVGAVLPPWKWRPD